MRQAAQAAMQMIEYLGGLVPSAVPAPQTTCSRGWSPAMIPRAGWTSGSS